MMGQEDVKKAEEMKMAEGGVSSESAAPPPAQVDLANVAEEKVIRLTPREKMLLEGNSELEGMTQDETFTETFGKVYRDPSAGKSASTSLNIDTSQAKLESKKVSLIKAWKESEKAKAENKAVKMMSTISAWENSKKAAIEADLKKMERKLTKKTSMINEHEVLENKKAEYAEKQKNKIAKIHKEAEKKRAIVAAKRREDLLKAEEMAVKYHATGLSPKKLWFF